MVSVIVPAFNAAAFVPEAVASIRAQNYPLLEIIVVDDASTDATAAVAEQIGGLTVCSHQHNRGPAAARNTGLNCARGELVAFLDADDRWAEGALNDQVNLMLATGAEVVLGHTRDLNDAMHPDPAARSGVVPMLGSALFVRSAFERVGRFDETLRYSEDHDWFLRARELGISIHVAERVVLYHRTHPASMTQAPDHPGDFQLLSVLKRSLDRRRAQSEGITVSLPGLGVSPERPAPRSMQAARTSVIIPVYNGSRYLADAIESVLAQTSPALEIIVVDDGSVDDSVSIAARYMPRVRCHRQDNSGTGAARNTGVQLARGDYLAFLDQDDLWEPDKLAVQMALLANNPKLDGVFGMVEQFHESQASGVVTSLGRYKGCLPSAMIIRRAAFSRVGAFETCWQLGEWANWYARAVEAGLRFDKPEQLVVRRRVHQANKGVVRSECRREYAQILKASLDRRRTRTGVQ